MTTLPSHSLHLVHLAIVQEYAHQELFAEAAEPFLDHLCIAFTPSGRSATAQYDAPQGSFEEAVELIVGQLHIVLVFSGQSATAKDDTPQ